MSRDYDRLDIVRFGAHLLETGDLDPVYIALDRMEMDQPQLHRWLLAYWCLYHCGAASWLSEQKESRFWEALHDAAHNQVPAPTGGRWPRGHERRHFRGAQGIAAVRDLRDRYGAQPEQMVSYVMSGDYGETIRAPFSLVAERAKEHRGFGDWMAFKICDMADRVLGYDVDFSEADVFMFKDPKEAAIRLWRHHNNFSEEIKPRDEMAVIRLVVAWLQERLGHHMAPPRRDRRVNLQELETVLCKWKSHMNGHYPLFNDIDEIRAGLLPWSLHSDTARAMLHAMPQGSRR